MKRRYTLCIFMLIFPLIVFTQVKDIYFGGGYSDQITATSSNNALLYPGIDTAFASNTLNRNGLIAPRMEASRFLTQAAFGGSPALIDEVVSMGIESWIDSQFIKIPLFFTDSVKMIHFDAKNNYINNGGTGFYPSIPAQEHVNYTWWQTIMTSEDILRQKIAYALSQILVISAEGPLGNYGVGLANYYDIFIRNAFGNYHDILFEVSTHSAMGEYLTFYQNNKTDLSTNTFPDENYAREVMQLFTIGLDSLNIDGTAALDVIGNRIPTYDNDDIAEFAKVFTGLGAGGVADRLDYIDEPTFSLSYSGSQLDIPMKMYESNHEQGEKHLLNGYTIPSGQLGMEDIEDAVQHLFDHPNVAPFISYRLIQRLIKSNPTPEYVAHVANIFNNNGSGEKGNLKDVVKAILLHPEARDCNWINDPNQGKLREPIIRKTHFLNTIGLNLSSLDNYWNYHSWFFSETGQHPLHSPSVFNFYKPGFSPNGAISDAGNVAPEFEIYNSRTSIGFARQVFRWIEDSTALSTTWRDGYHKTSMDFNPLIEKAKDADALIDYLDVMLTQGMLSYNTRSIIKTTINTYDTSEYGIESRIKLATYLIMISPDYNILK